MDRRTAETLCELNAGFYEAYAQDFAATRQAPWPGWQRCLDESNISETMAASVEQLGTAHATPLSVLDIGCGNLRFLKYLRLQLPAEVQLESYAVDNCEFLLPSEEELAHDYPFVRFQKLDVLGRVIHEASLLHALEAPRCQLVTCFGLMHHTPGVPYRQRFLADLVRCCTSEGHVVVSFWQFMDSPELAQQAQAAHAQACARLNIAQQALDAGDFLLGWQNQPGAVRYCHHFTDAEIDGLVASLGRAAAVKARFKADGRTGALNTYVVLQAR